MIQRLYINNFRCMQNFELNLKAMPSALLIGKNGRGKSTIGAALELLQGIGRGINRVDQLVRTDDFFRGIKDVPIRFELEVRIDGKLYYYILAFDLPENFKKIRIFQEKLIIENNPIYSREEGQVTLHSNDAEFIVDWHLVALPVIQEQRKGPLEIFKTWLARMIILDPIPGLMSGESGEETLEPKRDGSNFGEWYSGLLGRYPAAYAELKNHLSKTMPDIQDLQNDPIGKDFKSMNVGFQANQAKMRIPFNDLSDGEKCFFLCALVLTANEYYGPIFCFWDEPDHHLSLSELGDFIMSLRRSFDASGGQILVTSHHPETIRRFSDENTLVLDRKSHLEPTLVRPLSELSVRGDLIEELILDDVEI